MKRKLLQVRKMLLVAAGLLVGASAWAEVGDETVNANIDCTGTITEGVLQGTVNSMTIGTGGAATEIVNNSYMKLGDHENVVTIPEEQYAGTRDAVEVSFDMAWGNKSGMGNGIYLKDAANETIAYLDYARWGGGSDNLGIGDIYAIMGGHSGNIAVWDNKTHFVVTIDYAKKIISTVATLGKTTTTFSAALTNTNPVASFTVKGYNAGGNADRAGLFGNLIIKTIEGDYDVQTAKYTVQWKEGNEVVKEDKDREGDVNSEITLLPADITNFFVDDVKYIVTANDATGKTIAADGTTVVTISVRKAEKWAYTVTSSYNNNTLAWEAAGEVWEDEPNVTISYPRYQANGSLLVEKKPNGNDLQQGIVVANNGFTTSFEYAATDITNLYFVSEAEDLNTNLAQSGTTYSSRVSSGKIIYGGEGELFKLPAGKYIVTLGVIGGDGNSHKVAYTISAGDDEIASFECNSNFLTLGKSNEFTVNEETAITFTSSDASSDRGIDLVYVQRFVETVTIGETGYTTFASAEALNLDELPENVTAYYASGVNGEFVILTEVEGQVAKGTGLILAGTPSTYSIPVVASGETIATNKLVGCTTETELNANENLYVLVNNNGTAEFQCLADNGATIPVGKAYLNVPAAGARLNIVFAGETTGIAEVATAGAENGAIYNLSGQRVSKPANGLYIVNGKKVIIK